MDIGLKIFHHLYSYLYLQIYSCLFIILHLFRFEWRVPWGCNLNRSTSLQRLMITTLNPIEGKVRREDRTNINTNDYTDQCQRNHNANSVRDSRITTRMTKSMITRSWKPLGWAAKQTKIVQKRWKLIFSLVVIIVGLFCVGNIRTCGPFMNLCLFDS